ncbi:MAG: L,D-transpeptidase family protein [Pseudomonadota bacterium]
MSVCIRQCPTLWSPRWLHCLVGCLALLTVLLVFITSSSTPSQAQWGSQWAGSSPQYLTGAQRRRLQRQRKRRARTRARQRRQHRRTRSRRGKSKAIRSARLPKRQPDSGPIQIVVSLGRQRMTVYEAGKPVGKTRVSTGKDGHETPTGIFSIIHKRRRHFSNIYHNAPMPFMQRLTWSGIALHQGVVPNYRASHGCIRLPSGFAGRLFGFTERRSHVVIADGNPVPQAIEHSMLFQPSLQPSTVKETAHTNQQHVRVAMNSANGNTTNDAAPTAIANRTKTSSVAKKTEAAKSSKALKLRASIDSDPELLAHRQLMFATRSDAPLRILIIRKSQKQRIKEAQEMLRDLGYDVGEPDGYIGRQSIQAIKAFQSDKELTVTGYPNQQLYDALFAATKRTAKHKAFIHVRQKQKDIYSAPVELVSPEKPLGTHLYTLMSIDADSGKASWNGLTAKARGRLPGQKRKTGKKNTIQVDAQTMGQALDRVRIPDHVRLRIEDMLTPGSSLIIADTGHTRETGINTDFIVLTK